MQKFCSIFLLTFGSWNYLFCQDLQKVDKIVLGYEELNHRTPEKLAEQINQDFFTDLEKARAIYTWIALNVEYDIEAYIKGTNRFSYTYKNNEDRLIKEEQRKKKVAEYTYKKRKGVCDGYANLFQNLSELTGIESEIIHGYSKTRIGDIGRKPSRTDHAWNSVKIDDKWILIDATWGAGSVSGNYFTKEFDPVYFDTKPERFNLNHYPSDSKWVLSKISKNDFIEAPLYYSSYMNSNFEIKSPNSGFIDIKEDKDIIIKIESESKPTSIMYHYSRDQYSSFLNFEKNGKYWEGIIPPPKGKSSTLTLFYRNKGLVAYQLKYKRS